MKLAFALVALLTLSAHAQSNRPLKRILATNSCEMKIVKTPVIFAKEKIRTLSGGLVFAATEWSPNLRRLKVNRTLKIHAMSEKHILLDDSSISSVCVFNPATRKCVRNIESLTISQIEEKSGKNVKIICKRDEVQDI